MPLLNLTVSGTKPVPASGPLECLIAICGQAPGEQEEYDGKPFTGAAGSLLNTKLHMNGVARHQCYITNLSKERPGTWWSARSGLYNGQKYDEPENKNDFSIFWNGTQPTQYLNDCKEELLKELCNVKTNVIVACGGDALWALTGHKEISKYRGSILSCTLPNGKVVKVIGTWHPAAIWKPLKNISPGAMAHIIQMDLGKAVKQAAFPELRLPSRTLITKPSFHTVRSFILDHSKESAVAYDIETAPDAILCLSLAFNRNEAISIPTTPEYWGSVSNLHFILSMINTILGKSDMLKIAQFMNYDFQWLFRFFNIYIKKNWYDNAIAHMACYPEFPKGHDFLCSMYTDEVYYKDELKIWIKGASDIERLWQYNARDAASEFEVYEETNIEMDELNVRHTFDYMMELMEPLLFIMLFGMRFDKDAAAKHRTFQTDRNDKHEAILSEKYGEFNPRSPKQILGLLDKLGIDPVIKDGKPSTNKKALEKLAKKNPELASIIEVKNSRKIISTYVDVGLDPVDERFRFTLNQTRAVTGRLSSSESCFWGVGANSENIPKSLRDQFIPDPGLVFTEADLVGAEAVVVAYLTEDPLLINLFEIGYAEPEPGFKFTNVHALTAYLIWHKSEAEVKAERKRLDAAGRDTESMYFKGKKTRHSANYLATWRSLSDELRISAAEAKMLLSRFYQMSPNVKRWQKEVEAQLSKNRTIITCLGRRRTFYDLWSQELLRTAVAYEPQETVVHVLNIGLIRVYNELCKKYKEVSLLNQVHDSMLLQHPPEMTEFIHSELHRLMRVDLNIKGRDFYIKSDIKTSSIHPRLEEGWWLTDEGRWEWGRFKNVNNWRDIE